MKNKEHEKQFMEAMTKTLHNYEDLIGTGDKSNWVEYGSCHGCLICGVMESYRPQHEHNCCVPCPLDNCTHYDEGTHDALFNALKYDYPESQLKHRAKRRYNWLIKKIGENGYEYK